MANNSAILGVDLLDTPTASNGHALGQRATAADGQEYVYVQAAEAITQYDFVGIDENFAASKLTKTIADDGWEIGVAQVAFAASDYGWIATKGSNLTGFILASCAVDVALYTSGTAGKLDDSSTSQTKIDGVVAVVGNSSNTARAKEVLLTFPRSSTF